VAPQLVGSQRVEVGLPTFVTDAPISELVRRTRHVEHAGTTEAGETVGGSSGSCEFSSGGCSAEMISNACPDADGKVLIKGICENLLPAAQAWRLGWSGPPVAAPSAGNGHIDMFCYLIPGQALVSKLHDLFGGGGMCRRTWATHDDHTA
jgi:hypothetical protein